MSHQPDHDPNDVERGIDKAKTREAEARVQAILYKLSIESTYKNPQLVANDRATRRALITRPELAPTDQISYYAYLLSTEECGFHQLLEAGAMQVPLISLIDRQYILHFVSNEVFAQSTRKNEKNGNLKSMSFDDLRALGKITREGNITPDFSSRLQSNREDVAVSMIICLQLMVKNSTIEALKEMLQAREISWKALASGFQALMRPDSLRVLKNHGLFMEENKETFFLALEEWLTEVALKVSFATGTGKDRLSFPFDYYQGDHLYPPIEFLPYILSAHLEYLFALPDFVGVNQSVDWPRILAFTATLLGNFDTGELGFYHKVVRRAIVRDMQSTTWGGWIDDRSLSIQDFLPRVDIQLRETIKKLDAEMKYYGTAILRLLTFYQANPQLLNRKKEEDERNVEGSVREFHKLREEILQAGGRGPRNITFKARSIISGDDPQK
jgi:hypothetical protein